MSDLWCDCNPGFRYTSLATFARHYRSRRHRYHMLVLLQERHDTERLDRLYHTQKPRAEPGQEKGHGLLTSAPRPTSTVKIGRPP